MCTTADGSEIIEGIEYKDNDRSFRYTQLKVPLPVKSSKGMMTLKGDKNGSFVLWEAEIELPDPSRETETLTMIDGYCKQTLQSLRRLVEKGTRH